MPARSTSSDLDIGDTLTYSWNFGDGSPPLTTTGATTSHTYTAAGSFTATLTVRDDRGLQSTPAQVRIDPGNRAPEVTIDTPTAAARFAVGDAIPLHATATDPEDGTLAPRHPHIDAGAREVGDHVGAGAAGNAADVERHAARWILKRGDSDDLVRQFVDSARSFRGIEPGMRRNAGDGQLELAAALS